MALDCFLKLDGIEGESFDAKHKREIDLLSFTFGMSSPRDYETHQATRRVSFSDADFTCYINAAYPRLCNACASNQKIKEATLFMRKAGTGKNLGQTLEYANIKLTDVYISKCQLHGQENPGEAPDIPIVSFSLNFAKIEWEYREQLASGGLQGPIKFNFDLMAGK
jgi:type VI secretion system secreted protein Hcp